MATKAPPYDPEPTRERLRGGLAIATIGLLIFVVAGAFTLAALGTTPLAELKEFVIAILAVVAPLVSAVIGFYYGSSRGRG